jgi:hypothetical protein
VIDAIWRAVSNDNMTNLFPNRKVASKLDGPRNKELATYFLSGGRVE